MHRRAEKKFSLLFLTLLVFVFLAIIVSTGMGYMTILPSDILRVIGTSVFGDPSLSEGIQATVPYVVMDVRLPRILTAALVGAGLALSGVIYQGILLNPLADPYTLGISSGAAFGASLALLANVTMLGHFSTPVFAFVGAILTLLLVMRLSTFNGQISAQTLILSGVIVGAILSAGISFLKYLADEQVAVIIFWLMGSFASSTWNGVMLVGAALLFGILVTIILWSGPEYHEPWQAIVRHPWRGNSKGKKDSFAYRVTGGSCLRGRNRHHRFYRTDCTASNALPGRARQPKTAAGVRPGRGNSAALS